MATLEEIMAGLFEGTAARGAQGLGNVAPASDQDPRRRRAGRGSGYEGLAGGNVSMMDLLPHLQGIRSFDYSGPMLRGLADLVPGGRFQDVTGPARRHLERQGGQFGQQMELPPGLMQGQGPGDNRNPLGGPNVAPGNLDTGFAVQQPQGIGPQAPHSQGWRNVAPGYSAAAGLGYGTPEFEERLRGGGIQQPGGQPVAPGGGGGGGDNRNQPGSRGGGDTSGGGATVGRGGNRVVNDTGGAPAPSAPSGGRTGGRSASSDRTAPANTRLDSTRVREAMQGEAPDSGRVGGGRILGPDYEANRLGARMSPESQELQDGRAGMAAALRDPDGPYAVRNGRQVGTGKEVTVAKQEGRYANESNADRKARLAAKSERKAAAARRTQTQRNTATYGTPEAPAPAEDFSGLRRPPTAGKTRPARTAPRRNLIK